jgi:ribosomal protein S27E
MEENIVDPLTGREIDDSKFSDPKRDPATHILTVKCNYCESRDVVIGGDNFCECRNCGWCGYI